MREIIEIVAGFFYLAIFARAILSWFPTLPRSNPLVRFVFNVTEPLLAPIRRFLLLAPIRRFLPTFGMMDFSPIVALLLLTLVRDVLLRALA